MKSLRDISWKVPESVYRKDNALSYSTLSKYEREVVTGKLSIDHLFDRIDTKSLKLGSAVDCIITDGFNDFNKRFVVCDFNCSDGITKIVNQIIIDNAYKNIHDIPLDTLNKIAKRAGYYVQSDSRRLTEIKKLDFDQIQKYISIVKQNPSKQILFQKEWDQIFNAVHALKNNENTEIYFDTSKTQGIERLYQLKFKALLGGVNYRCMMDLVIVNHNEKTIIPIDLKTSSHLETEFPKSFLQWFYTIQARLYFRILEDNIKRDSYFKDFTILPYRFVVVNFNTCNPMVWEYEDTFKYGTLEYNGVVLRDPFEIGKELFYRLHNIKIQSYNTLNHIVQYLTNDTNTPTEFCVNTQTNEKNDFKFNVIQNLIANYHTRHNVIPSNDILHMLNDDTKIVFVKKWCVCEDWSNTKFRELIIPLIEQYKSDIDKSCKK